MSFGHRPTTAPLPLPTAGMTSPNFTLLAFLAATLTLAACNPLESLDGQDLQKIEQLVRDQPGRGGKVGALRAMEVASQARQVAIAMASTPDPACALPALQAPGPWTFRANVRIEGDPEFDDQRQWQEQRELHKAADGSLRLVVRASYRTELGQTAEQRREAHIDKGQLTLVADSGQRATRPLDGGEAERLELEWTSAMQELLDSSDSGWKSLVPADGQRAWIAGGGQPLRCGTQNPLARPWLERLEVRARLADARLEVEGPEGARRRRLKAAWRLSDGNSLRLEYEDTLVPGEAEASVALATSSATPQQPLVALERNRDWSAAGTLLETLVRQKWVEPRTWPPEDQGVEKKP